MNKQVIWWLWGAVVFTVTAIVRNQPAWLIGTAAMIGGAYARDWFRCRQAARRTRKEQEL